MRSTRPTVVVVCNAFDDETRMQRRIRTDSPAASRKIFQMCMALKLAGVRPYVLSLGRGRSDGGNDSFASRVCRVNGVPTIYAPFSHRRWWSGVLSLFGLLVPILRLANRSDCAAIFYNRLAAYLPVLFTAFFSGYKCVLDLEDGEVSAGSTFRERIGGFVIGQFERCCRGGALLACSALAEMTKIRPVYCYYGIAAGGDDAQRWRDGSISCLMSGTLQQDTGALLLLDTIQRLRASRPQWANGLVFEVTGKGESLAEFYRLAAEPGFPKVVVHGRISDIQYLEILRRCDVGLALKPIGGKLANTTFPSKVVEFASSGLLVLSTDISDVRSLLGTGARYLKENDAELLIKELAEIVCDHETAKNCARIGRQAVNEFCDPERAGRDLKKFLFGNLA